MNRPLALSFALIATLITGASLADPPAAAQPAAARSLTYRAFMTEVARGNLELAAARMNVPIAEAQVAVAKIFPDPVLTAGVASVDVSGHGSPLTTTVGLSVALELGGKRSARVAAAEAEKEQVKAELEDALRTLRGNATNAFIDCLYARLVLDRKEQTQKALERLVGVNKERARAGDISNVPLTQSRVEAQRFQGEVLIAEADVAAADLALVGFAGGKKAGSLGVPTGDLKLKPRSFNVDALIAQARALRPDLLARQRAAETATARVDLAHANRWVDVTLNVGWQHSVAGTGAFMGQPPFDSLGTTVSVPLPLSRVYRGELDGALATEAQGKTTVQATGLRIEVEVRQAYARYKASVSRLGLYTGGLLADADQVLESTLYTYQRGGGTLLEVLEAQRTDNDVYLTYADALADHARALVALEQAAGIWDIDL